VQKKQRFKEAKAKRERGGFVALPFVVIRSESWSRLSAHAIKLLCDLLAQYRGDNNGDLTCAWTIMHARGWRSRDTLEKARRELLEHGWIIVTRQGGRHQASLYAVTFYGIDGCNGKLDVSASLVPSGLWRQNEPAQPLKVVSRPPCQLPDDQHARRVTKTA
jgi:hypothetical protein